jgi:hypothetical protein
MSVITNLLLVYCCIAPLALANGGSDQQGQETEGVYQFHLRYDRHSLFYIISLGDGISQTARLTVFDVIGNAKVQIRKLHHMELANLCQPKEHILCGAGRFFITFDEGYLFRNVRETKNLLAVYDLVRKERTIYTFDDLFTEEVLKQQGHANNENIEISEWRQSIGHADQHFDPNLLTFRIPLPEPKTNKEGSLYQEIVIDLPNRFANIRPAKTFVSIDDTRVTDRALEYPNNYIEPSHGMEQPNRLPQFLRLVNFRGHDQLVFEYDSNTEEYREVANEKWVLKDKLKSRCGSYTD